MLLAAVLAAGCGEDPGRISAGPALSETSESSPQPMLIEHDVRPWGEQGRLGRQIVTGHYDIFTPITDKPVVRYLPGFLEAAHRQYLSLTGLADAPQAERNVVYLMADSQQWDDLTRHRTGRSIDITAGGYCLDGVCVFWDIGVMGTLSVAAHEGFHQFFHHRLQDRQPMWLEEGLCVTIEGYRVDGSTVVFTPDRNVSRFTALRKVIVNGLSLPLEELLVLHSMEAAQNISTRKAVGYYAQLWALVHMIRNTPRYRQGMERMLRDAEAGRYGEALGMSRAQLAALRRDPLRYNREVSLPLFRHYIAEDLPAFQREYEDYARRLAGL
jgi:hypothetical protein